MNTSREFKDVADYNKSKINKNHRAGKKKSLLRRLLKLEDGHEKVQFENDKEMVLEDLDYLLLHHLVFYPIMFEKLKNDSLFF